MNLIKIDKEYFRCPIRWISHEGIKSISLAYGYRTYQGTKDQKITGICVDYKGAKFGEYFRFSDELLGEGGIGEEEAEEKLEEFTISMQQKLNSVFQDNT